VNWFRKSKNGEGNFMWPGFGENIRVLEWIFKRVENPDMLNLARKTPMGYIPAPGSFDLEGLNMSSKEFDELFKLDKQFLLDEVEDIKAYFDENVNESTPTEMYDQINDYKQRILEEM
jgi:phosphoenolpyruvate carboxykinase (GTP)